MLTNLFLSLNWTRDDAKWLIGRLVSAATILLMFSAMPASAFASALPPAAAGLLQQLVAVHPNLTGTVQLGAIVILYLAGKYDSSPLPGKPK